MSSTTMPEETGRNETAMSCNATPVISFDDLYTQYRRFVWKRLYGLCHDVHVTEDLSQEVFLRAFRYLPRLDHDKYLGAWLYRIATNCYHDYQREQVRKQALINEYSWEGFQETYNSEYPQEEIIDRRQLDPATQLANNELRQQAFDRLNPAHQLELRRWFHNKPYDRQEVYKARKNLKEMLERLERQAVA